MDFKQKKNTISFIFHKYHIPDSTKNGLQKKVERSIKESLGKKWSSVSLKLVVQEEF